MSLIQAVLFDLDGTLLDRHGSLVIYVHQQMQRCRSMLDGISLVEYLPKVVELDARGHTTKGVKKPDPEIFHRALRTLNVRAQDTVFVGDNPEADIRAAKAVGLKAVWMEDSYWPAPRDADATISDLCALPETIDRINTGEAQHRRAW
jgi:FMN phosphatase YigB (HAD superfamily)